MVSRPAKVEVAEDEVATKREASTYPVMIKEDVLAETPVPGCVHAS